MATYINNPYTHTANTTLISQIENCRKSDENNCLPEWWQVGSTFCTQNSRGYYHVWVLENTQYAGRGVYDYIIKRDGTMHKTDNFYSLPTKDDFIKWCADRDIKISKDA